MPPVSALRASVDVVGQLSDERLLFQQSYWLFHEPEIWLHVTDNAQTGLHVHRAPADIPDAPRIRARKCRTWRRRPTCDDILRPATLYESVNVIFEAPRVYVSNDAWGKSFVYIYGQDLHVVVTAESSFNAS